MQVKCECCSTEFSARPADRKRGWARFCSKRCKAIKQEARTGQYANRLARENDFDDMECHPFSEDAFNL